MQNENVFHVLSKLFRILSARINKHCAHIYCCCYRYIDPKQL